MPTEAPAFTIGTLARRAAVNVETIRFYQRKGLLPQPPRPPGGVRRYRAGDVARIRFIKSAQRLGFSLDEVKQLLALDDGSACGPARLRAEKKLIDVRAKLADLKRIERVLQRLIADCARTRGTVSCPLIAALQERH